MRGVLIGADLMYREDGKIVPIEINTNVGWDITNRMETESEALDAADLIQYAIDKGITDVYLEGQVNRLAEYWPKDCSVKVHSIFKEDLETLEDGETDLVIRTSYSDEAYVDNFCRDKINFLNAIKGESFGAEWILKSEGKLLGSITKLYQNGVYPNIVVKYRYPQYDRNVYPLCLNFKTLEDLNAWAEEHLEDDYFMMPFYYNSKKGIYVETEEGHEDHKRIQFFRNWSAFIANEEGTLDSIQLGRYTKFTGVLDESKLEWNEDGTAKDPDAVREMLFQDKWTKTNVADLLLDEDDIVLMEDQTWKKAQDLKVGDKVQAISIPVSGAVDIREHTADYNVPYEEFAEESHWVVNEIQVVHKVEAWFDEIVFKFIDGTDWYDTVQSSYPTLDPEDDTVKFVTLSDLKVGDKIILMPIDAESLENPTFVVKEVASVDVRRKLQRGYSISLDGNHLFLSKTSEDTLAYIAIEHNAVFKYCLCEYRPSSVKPDPAGTTCLCECTCLGTAAACATPEPGYTGGECYGDCVLQDDSCTKG